MGAMADVSSSEDSRRLSGLRTTNTFLAIAILILLGQVAYQQMRISSLRADLDQARREFDTKVERIAMERMQGQRAEMVAAVAFVDDLYRSADGLQRPGGLYNIEAKRVDAEAIGTWILDVYMKARIEGKSDAEARQSITDAIKGSDEWRSKHPK
jgi:hypothetical protein